MPKNTDLHQKLESPEVKELLENYKKERLHLLTSPREDQDISQCQKAFLHAYLPLLEQLLSLAYTPKGEPAYPSDPIASRFYNNESVIPLMEEYKKMKTEAAAQKDLKASGNPMDDPTVPQEVKQGVRSFHKWMLRNCDKSGFEHLGSNGSTRDFCEEFMKKPLRVQLKALYLLETDKRKCPDISDDVKSQNGYVPNLDAIKDKMIATRFKFWKRFDGSHMYWEKLSQSLNIADKSSSQLSQYSLTDHQELANASMEKTKDSAEPKTEKAVSRLTEKLGLLKPKLNPASSGTDTKEKTEKDLALEKSCLELGKVLKDISEDVKENQGRLSAEGKAQLEPRLNKALSGLGHTLNSVNNSKNKAELFLDAVEAADPVATANALYGISLDIISTAYSTCGGNNGHADTSSIHLLSSYTKPMGCVMGFITELSLANTFANNLHSFYTGISTNNTFDNLSAAAELTGNAGDIGSRIINNTQTVLDFTGIHSAAAETTLNTAGQCLGIVSGAAIMTKNAFSFISAKKGEAHLKEAQEYLFPNPSKEEPQPNAKEKKFLDRIVNFSKGRSELLKSNSKFRATQGVIETTGCALASFAPAVGSVLGSVLLAVSAGMCMYDTLARSCKNRMAQNRMAIDSHSKTQEKLLKLKENLENRLISFKDKSPEKVAIQEKLVKIEQMENDIRTLHGAKKGFEHQSAYANSIVNKYAKKLRDHFLYKGGIVSEQNKITQDMPDYKELMSGRTEEGKKLLGYKNLIESLGVSPSHPKRPENKSKTTTKTIAESMIKK